MGTGVGADEREGHRWRSAGPSPAEWEGLGGALGGQPRSRWGQAQVLDPQVPHHARTRCPCTCPTRAAAERIRPCMTSNSRPVRRIKLHAVSDCDGAGNQAADKSSAELMFIPSNHAHRTDTLPNATSE